MDHAGRCGFDEIEVIEYWLNPLFAQQKTYFIENVSEFEEERWESSRLVRPSLTPMSGVIYHGGIDMSTGGFKDTHTRFSFYFPPKELYKGRFFQYLERASFLVF